MPANGDMASGTAMTGRGETDIGRVLSLAGIVQSGASGLPADLPPGGPRSRLAALLARHCRLASGPITVSPAGRHLAADEREHDPQVDLTLTVLAPDPQPLAELWDLLTGTGRLAPDGGEFSPDDGLIGRTVLSFLSPATSPPAWPRRLRLLIDGDHPILATHREATRSAGLGPEAHDPGACATLARPVGPPDEYEPTRRMLELLTGAWATQALCAAAELGVADHLAAAPATSAELAVEVGADADLLHRVLRYLESLGVLDRTGQLWQLTELGQTLRTGALRDIARLYGGLFYRSFGSLAHSVRTGDNAFQDALGMAPFDYLDAHSDDARIFHGAMAAGSSWFSRVTEVLNFSGVRTVVDVAGGRGDLLRHVLTAYPATRGILFDRPAAIDIAREQLARDGLLGRCETVTGDFSRGVPSGGDVYLLSRILHDWDDEQCLRILASCRRAIPESALLVVIERPIPTDGRRSLAVAWDVHMSVNNIGGRERTKEEYQRLLNEAGFSLLDARPLALDMEAMTAAPRLR